MNLTEQLASHVKVMSTLDTLSDILTASIETCTDALKRGGKIFICGNGGSASDAQHLAAEFIGRFTIDRKPLPAICLNTDTSAITCISNDYSFDEVFSRQLQGLASSNDVLIVFSTSGNSVNILKVCIKARELKIPCIGFLGKGGGKVKNYCDYPMIVPSNSTARIQEAHIFLAHYLCGEIEKRGFI
jgi:D-sedoheptulose 7-phosphate isomerase